MVKRIVVIAIFLLTSGLYANAQVLYGVKIGGGLAYQGITGTDILSASSIKTFNATAIAQIPLQDDIWLSGGVGFAGKGSVVYNDALTTTMHLSYIEVPVNILRKFTFTSLGKFYLGAGGYVAAGIAGKLDYETPGSNTGDKVKFGAENDLKKIDAGLNFLTGFEFRNKLTFNIGYTVGLNNIASHPQQDSGTSVVKNRVFSVGLGYLFSLK
jgi:hypothetical protein